MFWRQRTKLQRSVVIAGTASLAIGSAVSAAGFMPGGLGDIGGGLFGGGDSGGTFYDFESVFSDGSSGGGSDSLGLGGVFNDLFGGSDGLGIIEGLIGGDGGGLVSDCGIIIMNFSGGCDSDSLGNILFDTVMGEVSSELGLPDDIAGIMTGRQSVEGLFADVVNEELAKLGVGGSKGGFELGSIVGQQGLPSPDGLLDELLTGSKKPTFTSTTGGNLPTMGDGKSGGVAASVLTPGVNTSLVKPMLALEMLTKAVTDRGLSEKGQEVTTARNMAAQASARTSGMIGEKSIESAQKQLEAAAEMNDTVRDQESTQDTLKEALTGMNMLQAESTKLQAQANSQQAIASQVDGMNLQVSQEMRDGVFANGISLKTLNDQALAESQREMAANHSTRAENAVPLRMMGAYR